MNRAQSTITTIAVVTIVVSGCTGDAPARESQEPDNVPVTRDERSEATRGDRDRDGGSRSAEDGEESGTELALTDDYEETRNGVRLTLSYDADANAFRGAVENTTNDTLRQVRVEVHLSNGQELGPTTATDLGPGEQRDVALTATSTDFNSWSAHSEVGSDEHEDGEEGDEHE